MAVQKPNTTPLRPSKTVERLDRQIAGGLMLGAGVLLFASFGLLVWNGIIWLRDGQWASITCGSVWFGLGGNLPHFNWLGIQKLALWLLAQDLGVTLFALSIIVGYAGAKLSDAAR